MSSHTLLDYKSIFYWHFYIGINLLVSHDMKSDLSFTFENMI